MSTPLKRDEPPSPTQDDASTPSKKVRLEEPEAPSGPTTPASTSTVETSLTAAAEEVASPAPTGGVETPTLRRTNTERGGKKGKRGGSKGWPDRREAIARGKGEQKKDKGKSRNEEQKAAGGDAEDDEKKERLPKRKVAVLFGYNGIGYSGSQINPEVKTIEGELFEAFVKAGTVSEDNSTNPQKVGLSRAARTDAGVHAAVNVISLKLILSPPGLPPSTTIEAHINSFLPPSIRIWAIIPVQGSFNPRSNCDERQYEYTLPTHAFIGPRAGSLMAVMLEKGRQSARAAAKAAAELANGTASRPSTPLATIQEPVASTSELSLESDLAAAETDKFWAGVDGEASPEELMKKRREWRIPPAQLEKARKTFKAYAGSHNFYNYTIGKDFRDRSANRVMRKLEVTDPFIVNEVEYVSVRFLGQSFMLHQIRKMMGIAILAIRSGTPPSLIPETFGPSRIHVPKAPSLGLLLLSPHYVEYNKRVAANNVLLGKAKSKGKDVDRDNGGLKDPIGLGEEILAQVETFKKSQVYKKMWEFEEKEAVYTKWQAFLDQHEGSDFEYLNPKGVIPPSAVLKKGETAVNKTQGGEAGPISDDEAGGGKDGSDD